MRRFPSGTCIRDQGIWKRGDDRSKPRGWRLGRSRLNWATDEGENACESGRPYKVKEVKGDNSVFVLRSRKVRDLHCTIIGGADTASERQRISGRNKYEVDKTVDPMVLNAGRLSATSRWDEMVLRIIPNGATECATKSTSL